MADLANLPVQAGAAARRTRVLNIRVEPRLAEEFKVEAIRRHGSQCRLFEEMWRIYKEIEDGST